jgi:hypothetical protein
VQDASGDHLVGGAGVVEERGDLEWVLNERDAVGTAPLARMLPLGVRDSSPRLWEPRYQIAHATSTDHPHASLCHAGISEKIPPACASARDGLLSRTSSGPRVRPFSGLGIGCCVVWVELRCW